MKTGRLDTGKTRFRNLVKVAPPTTPRLPLIHSTDTYLFEDALAAGEIRPQPCKVFENQPLTYFFYGRPAFRPNANADPSGLGHYFPVSLIFKPDCAAAITRIFPFDSGAFQDGLYGAFLHKKMMLGDFGLEPDPVTPGRLISLFFGNNGSYLKGRSIGAEKFDPAEFEAKSYAALIDAKDANSIDSRNSGIEIQTEETLSIPGTVAAVVIPSIFAAGATGAKLKSLGIEIIPYPIFERMKPGEYTSQISALCLDFLVRQKIVAANEL